MFVLCNRHLIAAEDKVVSEQKEDKGVVIAKKDFHQSASLHYSFKFVSVICIYKITKKPPQTDE